MKKVINLLYAFLAFLPFFAVLTMLFVNQQSGGFQFNDFIGVLENFKYQGIYSSINSVFTSMSVTLNSVCNSVICLISYELFCFMVYAISKVALFIPIKCLNVVENWCEVSK